MAARLRSRLSFARRKGAREQEAEPGTPVIGEVSGLLLRHRPDRKPTVFIPLGGPFGPWALRRKTTRVHPFGWGTGLAVRHGRSLAFAAPNRAWRISAYTEGTACLSPRRRSGPAPVLRRTLSRSPATAHDCTETRMGQSTAPRTSGKRPCWRPTLDALGLNDTCSETTLQP